MYLRNKADAIICKIVHQDNSREASAMQYMQQKYKDAEKALNDKVIMLFKFGF